MKRGGNAKNDKAQSNQHDQRIYAPTCSFGVFQFDISLRMQFSNSRTQNQNDACIMALSDSKLSMNLVVKYTNKCRYFITFDRLES